MLPNHLRAARHRRKAVRDARDAPPRAHRPRARARPRHRSGHLARAAHRAEEVRAFPSDVGELQGYLGDETRIAGVEATPGKGTHVPLYILGSSLFGAQLAARLGLPYAFASHFAPDALEEAVALYRRDFRPSAQRETPYVIAGLNVLAADTQEEAETQLVTVQRSRVRALLGRGQQWTDDDADAVLESPAGQHVKNMTRYAAVGVASEVKAYVERFAARAHADEVMTVHPAPTVPARLRSIELLAGPAA